MSSVSTLLLALTIADAPQLNERVHSNLPLIRTLQEKLDNGKKSSDEQKSLIVDCNRQLYEMQFLLFFNPALHRMSDQRTAARLAANAHASTYKTLARPHKLETKACELLFGVEDQAKRDFQKRHAAIKDYKAFKVNLDNLLPYERASNNRKG